MALKGSLHFGRCTYTEHRQAIVQHLRSGCHERQARQGTQIAAAKVTGSTQPELSRILRGQFRSVSVERLLAMLTRLGCKVDIVVRPQGRTTESAVIHFA